MTEISIPYTPIRKTMKWLQKTTKLTLLGRRVHVHFHPTGLPITGIIIVSSGIGDDCRNSTIIATQDLK